MHRRFHRIIATTFLALYSSQTFAQTDAKFLEKNLPDNSPKKISVTSEINSAITTASNPTPNSIADILLNKNVISLMFSDEQSYDIERAINKKLYGSEDPNSSGDSANPSEEDLIKIYGANVKSYIYLASIIYLDSNNWVVWINNQKITSDKNKKGNEIYLKSVERGKIKLLWTLSISKWKILSGRASESSAPKINSLNQVEVQFELKPNQTFILNSGKVVEGYAVSGVNKKEVVKKSNEMGIVKETLPATSAVTNSATPPIPTNTDIIPQAVVPATTPPSN